MGHSGSKNGCLSLWPARAWNRLYIRLEWVTATNKVFLVIAHFSSSLCCCNQTYGSSLTPPLLLFQFMTWIRYQQFARFGIWQARLKSCRDLDNATAEHYTILSTSAFQTSPVLISGNSGVDFKMLWICKEPGDIAKVVTWQHIYFLPICDATHPAQWLAGELQQYLVSLLDSGCKASKQSAHAHMHTHREAALSSAFTLTTWAAVFGSKLTHSKLDNAVRVLFICCSWRTRSLLFLQNHIVSISPLRHDHLPPLHVQCLESLVAARWNSLMFI